MSLFIRPQGVTGAVYNPERYDGIEIVFADTCQPAWSIALVRGDHSQPLTEPTTNRPLVERVHAFLVQYLQAPAGTVDMSVLVDTASKALEVERLRALVGEAEAQFTSARDSVIAPFDVPTPEALEEEKGRIEARLAELAVEHADPQAGAGDDVATPG